MTTINDFLKIKSKKPRKIARVKSNRSAHILNMYKANQVVQKYRTLVPSFSEMKQEKSLLRQLARGLFDGDKVYDFYLGNYDTVTALSTTGVISQLKSWSTAMGGSGNWSALASLFDEFVLDEVHISLVPYSSGFNVSGPAATAIAFDDDSLSLAPSTYNSVVVYPTCKFICPAVQGATLATEANSTGMPAYKIVHRRPYKVPNNSPTSNAQTTGWTDVGTPSNMLGQTLFYNNNVSTSSAAACYLILWQFHARFRCQQ